MIEIPLEPAVPLQPSMVINVSVPGPPAMLAEVHDVTDEHALVVPLRHEPL